MNIKTLANKIKNCKFDIVKSEGVMRLKEVVLII